MNIYLESYGCTLNHGEARYLKHLLQNANHRFTDNLDEADITILFTCCVIGTTENKMIRRARQFYELDKPLIVSGCMAMVQRDAISNVHSNVRFLEPKKIGSINDLLDELSDTFGIPFAAVDIPSGVDEKLYSKPLAYTPHDKDEPGDLEEEAGESIDAIVPIATGCRGQCTYCITRLARGKLKSHSPEEIIKTARRVLASGQYELRLTAQDTACYGYDRSDDIAKLLKKIVNIESEHDFRVRVGMMNPDSAKPILSKLIESYKHPRIFKFLHLPVQTGDDDMLSAMGRKYTVSEFQTIIDTFRAAFPKITLSTDIIVGYPGETEEQFDNSLDFIKKIRPNIVNITRFSSRPGTPAAKLKALAGSLVKSRSRKLTELRFDLSKSLNELEIGKEYRVLVTERVKKGSVLGRTDNYQPVVIRSELTLGSWQNILITDATDAYLIVERVM